jgi:L-fucose isomerase-like protein
VLTRPRLLPVHLEDQPAESFDTQLAHLKNLTGGLVDWLDPAHIDAPVPAQASAVVVPDLSGRAYRMVESFRRIDRPILLITSEFGTVSMWDWEIRDYLSRRGVATIAPTSLQECEDICRALATMEALRRSSMLVYQDDLGGGMQPEIFKRFYWWEDECVRDMQQAFGVTIEHRSFRALAARAAAVPDSRVQAEWARVASTVPMVGLPPSARTEALRMYLALRDELDEAGDVVAAGVNCLNESATSTTTPCLAWNLLFSERGLLWGCEADLTSMLTETLVHKSLRVPVMMTNLYPFLMGAAALKHERIPSFPEVDEPENHILAAHSGYFGEVPRSCATEWTARPPVLQIVNRNAHAIDARLSEGPTTIVKIASDMHTLAVTPAVLTNYVQYENSDCLNGAVLRVEDGYRFVEKLPSHHAILATGDLRRRVELMASVMGLTTQRL